MKTKRWQDWINLLLGAWVAISPWMLGFTSNSDVMTNSVIVGCAVVLLAIWAMVKDQDFQNWRHRHTPTA